MRQEFTCPTCGQKFKAETIDECPSCAADSTALLPRRSYLGAGTESVSDSLEPKKVKAERIEPEARNERPTSDLVSPQHLTTADLISAQNRTTYAIRSLAIFFFTTLCTSLFGYGLVGAGANAALKCSSYYSDCGSTGLVVGGWLIIAIGFLVGVIAGANELGKSKP